MAGKTKTAATAPTLTTDATDPQIPQPGALATEPPMRSLAQQVASESGKRAEAVPVAVKSEPTSVSEADYDWREIRAALREPPAIGAVYKRWNSNAKAEDRASVIGLTLRQGHAGAPVQWTATVVSAHGGIVPFTAPDPRPDVVPVSMWVPEDWRGEFNNTAWVPPIGE